MAIDEDRGDFTLYQGKVKAAPIEVQSLLVGGGYETNKTILNLSMFLSLEHLLIGSKCFHTVRSFTLDSMPNLKTVRVMSYSLSLANQKLNNGHCRIVNCPELYSISFGYQSFSDYHFLELRQLKSLKYLEIGHAGFHEGKLFSLRGRRM